MKKPKAVRNPAIAGRRRWGRAQDQQGQDPYKANAKLAEPSRCAQCGAVFHKGRWQWLPAPEDATVVTCPACHRTNDAFPAGLVTLTGGFLAKKRAEILRLVRHQEEAEKKEHPLNRIIRIEEKPDQIQISTTDMFLPRRIGEALKRTFQGKLDLGYEEDGYFIRVDWAREA